MIIDGFNVFCRCVSGQTFRGTCVYLQRFQEFPVFFCIFVFGINHSFNFCFFQLKFELSYCHLKISSGFDHINSVSIDTVLSIFIQHV